MSEFITVEEIVSTGLDTFLLLFCAEEGFDPSEHIYGSFLFRIPANTNNFLQNLRSVYIPEGLTIVCYNNSDYNIAAKASFGFKAIGFNSRVLIRVPSLMPIVVIISGCPKSLEFKKNIFRDIDYDVITTQKIFKENKTNLSLIKINYLGFDIIDLQGVLLTQEKIISYLESSGLAIPHSKCVVYGKKAFLVSLLLKYVGIRNICVMVDSLETCDTKSFDKESFLTDKICSNHTHNDSCNYNESLKINGLYYSSTFSHSMPNLRKQCCCMIF